MLPCQWVCLCASINLCDVGKREPCCSCAAIAGIQKSFFVCLSLPLLIPPFYPRLSFFLPNTFNPPVSPHLTFVYHSLLLISLHLSSFPSFILLSIPEPLAWHSISDTSCMSCPDDASALTDQPQCVSSGWRRGRRRLAWGTYRRYSVRHQLASLAADKCTICTFRDGLKTRRRLFLCRLLFC